MFKQLENSKFRNYDGKRILHSIKCGVSKNPDT